MDFSCHAFSGCLFCKKRVILLYKTCKAKKKGTFHMKITGIIEKYNPFTTDISIRSGKSARRPIPILSLSP